MPTSDPNNPPLHFGDWTYDPNRRLLLKAGEERRVKPLLDRLLRRLIQHAGATLGREQLIAEVWTRTHVNDEVLSRAIAELRALLDDEAREPRYIETLAKGGYRWMVAVATLPEVMRPQDPAEAGDPRFQRLPGRHAAFLSGVLIAAMLAVLGWLAFRQAPGDASAVNLLNARPLTADSRLELDPRFDRDGRVAYIRRAIDGSEHELVLVDRRGQRERVLWRSPHALRYPAPAPNGSGVAVLHWPEGHCEMLLIDLLDAQSRRLGDCGVASSPQWTKDASALLFSAPIGDAGAPSGLAMLDVGTGQVTGLTVAAHDEGHHVDPRLSTDGRWLIYASLRDGERQLWRTDWPALRQRESLLARPEPVDGHALAVDNTDIWVAGDLLRYRALHRLRLDRTIELVGGRGAQTIDVAADGALVWTQAEYDGDVWLTGTKANPVRSVASSRRHESQPAFSQDGRRLALVSNRGGSEGIVVVTLGEDAQTDQITPLALDPALRWVRPSWTGDDRALILTAYADNRTRLFRYLLDEARVEPLTDAEENAFHGIELADRRLYRRGVKGHFELVQTRLDNLRVEVVPVGQVSAYRANARWLVWRAPGDSGLRATPLDAPAMADPVASLDDGDSEAFALIDDWLYFAAEGKLWRRILPDGAPEQVALPNAIDASRPSLAVGPEGQLAVAGEPRVSMDLMIVTPSDG